MAQEFVASTGEDVEYKAYIRQFENPEENDENPRVAVLYVVATLTKPDSGWQFMLAPQADELDSWVLLEDAPGFRDDNRTYYIASGNREVPVDGEPKSIAVVSDEGTARVSVVPWD